MVVVPFHNQKIDAQKLKCYESGSKHENKKQTRSFNRETYRGFVAGICVLELLIPACEVQ